MVVDLKQDPICEVLDSMPRAMCKQWVYNEWTRWRQCGWDPGLRREIGIEFVSLHNGRRWFFFCERCLVEKPGMRGTYINADGHNSTDEESS